MHTTYTLMNPTKRCEIFDRLLSAVRYDFSCLIVEELSYPSALFESTI